MPEYKNTFTKAERLCNKRIITELFNYSGNQVINEYPFILKWQVNQTIITSFPAQIVITISRKYSSKAINRNRIRRQIRELYRCNKNRIYEYLELSHVHISLLLIFVGKEGLDFEFLKNRFNILIERFIKHNG